MEKAALVQRPDCMLRLNRGGSKIYSALFHLSDHVWTRPRIPCCSTTSHNFRDVFVFAVPQKHHKQVLVFFFGKWCSGFPLLRVFVW